MLSSLPEKNLRSVRNWREDYHAIEKYQFVHNFLPNPATGMRARLLSYKAILAYFFLLIFLFGVLRVVPFISPGILGYASDIYTQELLKYTNQMRVDEGLGRLSLDPLLSKAAEQKAKDMFKNDYWAHVSPSGTEPWDFILAEDYDYSFAGENLAKNFDTSREVVEAWYRSPTHRENLMSDKYVHVGFAVVDGILDGYETTLVVQMFGRPRNEAYIATAPELPEEQVTVEDNQVLEINTSNETLAVVSDQNADPVLDIEDTVKYIYFGFGTFMLVLLVLDIWYSKKHSIRKLTGHTAAHVMFFLVAFATLWLAISPGKIL